MKPAKKGPSLPGFDSDDAPEPTRPFTERFVPSTPRPYAEQIRSAQPGLFGGIPLKEGSVVREEPLAQPPPEPATFAERVRPSGEKGKARDIITAIRTLHQVEQRGTPATPAEREALERFGGFGPVALSIFPNPATGEYKDGWQETGEELKALLTPEEYDSAKRTTFSQFFTSPVVMGAMHEALSRLGVPATATVLEPGCGVGRFMTGHHRYIGVELDSISGRIARALHPEADIRIENFADTRLPALDAVIGNVPFADVKLDHKGQKFSLHDFCFAKSVDALKPGGVLALVTSHYTLDKQNAAIREYLSERADFLGAIRLPSDAFKREGTAVVTDIVFLRKRAPGQAENHADYEWKQSGPFSVDGTFVPVSRYFHNHPEMVLGTWTSKDTLYGEGYSIKSNGDLATQLAEAVGRLPQFEPLQSPSQQPNPPPPSATTPPFVPPPPEKHVSEGSFFVHESRIHQMIDGQAQPVVYGGGELWANGAMFGRRMGALIELRDIARRVLQSQNEGWSDEERDRARLRLNRAYEFFKSAYGPINKTTFSETKDGTTIRRMPNLAKFREDPDAMLVMALEEYDEETATAKKAPILLRDVVGQTPPITSVTSAEDGLLVSLNHRGVVDLPYIAQLYGKPEETVIAELGSLIYLNPETKHWEPADQYLSGNVRHKLAVAEKAGVNVEALKAVQPEDVLPGDIDANLGAPWIPADDIQAFAAHLFGVEPSSITVGHVQKDAVWSLEGDWSAERSVANTTDYGTGRASGLWLLDLALNMKTPVIYDPVPGDPDKRQVNQEETLKAKEKQKAIKEQFRGWIFSDPDRTERLVRLYNDTYNNLRPRVFDGSHLDFPGMSQALTLRQHQKDAVWRIMSGGNTLLAHVVGAGKAQPLDSKVLTPTGWTTMGRLRVGDEVIAGDGTATTVTGVFPQGPKEVFKLTFKDGGSTRACGDHLWLTQTADERQLWRSARDNGHVTVKGQPKVRTTDELIQTLGLRHCIPLVSPVQFSRRDVPLDPYTLGVLLGNATFANTTPRLAVPEDIQLDLIRLPEGVTAKYRTTPGRCPEVFLVAGNAKPNPLIWALKCHGLWGHRSRDKFVPPDYLLADADSRLALLQGLMDTDGGMSGRQARFTSYSSRLADDLVFLVRSLGGVAYLHIRPGAREGSLRYNVGVTMPEGICPFRLPRKMAAWHRPAAKKKWIVKRPLVSIQPDGIEPCQCISVAHPSQLYVTDDFIVTHNTGAMAAGAMKLKQAGLVKKPLVVCANHLLEQFAREFQQWYPNAKLLVATKDDFTKERRKLLTAKIASGDWDAIIVTHSSFERIGMSRDYQERFLREQIAEYDELLVDRAKEKYSKSARNLTKTIEKQKAAREAKLTDLLAEDKKDDGLVFDELGVDYVFYDEAGAVKNLETPTKMDRVAGIQTGGSERAFDMLMKAKYLHDKHCGITFANGTPIANSLVEMYTLQRFLDPDGLRDRGIDHFDAWAATFGEVVEAMEISPDGKTLKPRARFSKFINLPELQQMFRAFADVQTADMLNLPRPTLEGGKPHVVSCPMSDEQHEIQGKLVERYERIRNGGVDPREDNALAITTDGRKLALDARMLDAAAPDFPGSKVNAMVENVLGIWKRTADTKGTQMVFCDFGVNPTPWGYCAYDEIVEKLAGKGIPREQIAVVGDADSDAKKQALFEKVRNGAVRVLIGSTSKMGTGTNVQKRLVAMHHLDAPWKPSEVEQRDGRILRQGNQNAEVAIYRYVTEGSFDAYMWQALETKARFIAQIMTGESGLRQAEDVGGQELSYAEVKAIASGNPAVLTLAEAEAELQRLGVLRRSHTDEQYTSRVKLKELPQAIERAGKRLAALEADAKAIAGNNELIVGGKSIGHQDTALATALNRVPDQVDFRRQYPVGKFRGLTFGIDKHPGSAADVYLEGQAYRSAMLSRESQGPRAVWNALNRLATSYDEVIASVRAERELAERQLADYQERLGKPFRHAAYLDELTALRDRLKVALSGTSAEGEPTAAELAEQIKTLRASHQVEAAPVRMRKAEARKLVPKVEVQAPPAPEPVAEEPAEEQEPVPTFRQRVSRGGQMSLF